MIEVLSGNTQTVSFSNRGTTENQEALNWLKDVFDVCVDYNIRVFARYSPGVENISPDALSRLTDGKNLVKRFLETFEAEFPGSYQTLIDLYSSRRPQVRIGTTRSSEGRTRRGL